MQTKVLVVDDEPHILYLLRIVLKTEGFQVVICSEGPKVLEVIEKEHPQLLILDIMMPKMNGWDICKQLRDNPINKDLAVIILSAVPFRDDERRLVRELNIYDYIMKPFEPLQLLSIVRRFFGIPGSPRGMEGQAYREGDGKKGEPQLKTEVVVAGGGVAGITAACASASSGAEVILVEEAPFVGGELIGDHELVWHQEPALRSNRFLDLVRQLGGAQSYSKSNLEVLTPEVAREAAFRLLKENKINVQTNTYITEIMREGTLVKKVTLKRGKIQQTYDCDVLIDTTKEGRAAELVGIPMLAHPIDPKVNVILGGIDANGWEHLEEKRNELCEKYQLSLWPLASKQEALLFRLTLKGDHEQAFHEGLDEVLCTIRENWPGCQHAYILQRPFSVPIVKKTLTHDGFSDYRRVIPKSYERILVAGEPILNDEESSRLLSNLAYYGEAAGILAGLAVSLHRSTSDISPKVFQEAMHK